LGWLFFLGLSIIRCNSESAIDSRFKYVESEKSYKNYKIDSLHKDQLGLYFSGYNTYTSLYGALANWLAVVLTAGVMGLQIKQIADEKRRRREDAKSRENERKEDLSNFERQLAQKDLELRQAIEAQSVMQAQYESDAKMSKEKYEREEVFASFSMFMNRFDEISAFGQKSDKAFGYAHLWLKEWIDDVLGRRMDPKEDGLADLTKFIQDVKICGCILEAQRIQSGYYSGASLVILASMYEFMRDSSVVKMSKYIADYRDRIMPNRVSLNDFNQFRSLLDAMQPFRIFLDGIESDLSVRWQTEVESASQEGNG